MYCFVELCLLDDTFIWVSDYNYKKRQEMARLQGFNKPHWEFPIAFQHDKLVHSRVKIR
jgi:hypothetical protein